MAFPSGVKVDILINGQLVDERNCYVNSSAQIPCLHKFIDVFEGAHFSIRVTLDTKIHDDSAIGTSLIVQLESGLANSVPLTRLFSRRDLEHFALGPSHVFHGRYSKGENDIEILHPFVFECKEENRIEVYIRKVRKENLLKATRRNDVGCEGKADQEGPLVAVEVPPDGPDVCSENDAYGDPWLNFTFSYSVYDSVTKKQITYTPPFADDIETREINHLSLQEAREVVRRLKVVHSQSSYLLRYDADFILKARCETLTKEKEDVCTKIEHTKAGPLPEISPPKTITHGSPKLVQESTPAVLPQRCKPPYVFGGFSAPPSFYPAMNSMAAPTLLPNTGFDGASFEHNSYGHVFEFDVSTHSKLRNRASSVEKGGATGERAYIEGTNPFRGLTFSNFTTPQRVADHVDNNPTSPKPTKPSKGRDIKDMSEVGITTESAKGKPRETMPVNFADPIPSPTSEVDAPRQPGSETSSTVADRISAVLTAPVPTKGYEGHPTASRTLGSSLKAKRSGRKGIVSKAGTHPAENSGVSKPSATIIGSTWSQSRSQKKIENTDTDLAERYRNLSLGARPLRPVYGDAAVGSSPKAAARIETSEKVEEGVWEDSPVF
ncbi:MAG: hypothetical protein Q9174_006024 [Haloplaca sp. 1 TL-2023]